jgi:hypothetical protein
MGLLMAEGVMAEQGARTISIGSDIPLDKLSLAAIACKVDVVSLSFSFAFPRREVIPTLRHFRHLLPIHIQIWAGGSGLAGIKKYPKASVVQLAGKRRQGSLHISQHSNQVYPAYVITYTFVKSLNNPVS